MQQNGTCIGVTYRQEQFCSAKINYKSLVVFLKSVFFFVQEENG